MKSWLRFATVFAVFVPSTAFALPPDGYLDAAGCDVFQGWSRDPDEPTIPIAVHIYFGGPAGSGASAIATTANVYRGDLCAAIGSCEHGFIVPSPLSLHDGQARPMHAYGIDSMGGTNPELGSSPRTMMCSPVAPTGVRRPVDLQALAAWKFDSFWDLLPLDGASADGLPNGPAIAPSPELRKVEGATDAEDAYWLLDGGVKRPISPAALLAWRFDASMASVVMASELDAYVDGTPVRARPVMFIRGGLYLADDPQPDAPIPTSSASSGGAGGSESVGASGGEGSTGGSGGAGTESEVASGCGCRIEEAKRSSSPAGVLVISAFALALARRRSR